MLLLTVAVKLVNKAQKYLSSLIEKQSKDIVEKENALILARKELKIAQRMLKGIESATSEDDDSSSTPEKTKG